MKVLTAAGRLKEDSTFICMLRAAVPRRQGHPQRLASLLLCCFSLVACGERIRPATEPPWSVVEIRRTPWVSDISNATILDIGWLGDSVLIASVNQGASLVLLGWDGRIRKRVSRKGRGPGETTGAAWLLTRGDSLFVSIDILNRRAAWWTQSGELRYERQLDLPTITGAWGVNEGIALRTTSGGRSMTYTVLDDSAVTISMYQFPSTSTNPTSSCGYCPSAVSKDGEIAMGVSDTSYRILRTDLDGHWLSPFELAGVPAVRRSPQELAEVSKTWDRMMARLEASGAPSEGIEMIRRVAAAQRYKKRFVARTMLFDESGVLWVQRSVSDGDSAAVDVFADSVGHIGTFRLPPAVVMRRVRQNRLLATQMLSTGESIILEFEVEKSLP